MKVRKIEIGRSEICFDEDSGYVTFKRPNELPELVRFTDIEDVEAGQENKKGEYLFHINKRSPIKITDCLNQSGLSSIVLDDIDYCIEKMYESRLHH